MIIKAEKGSISASTPVNTIIHSLQKPFNGGIAAIATRGQHFSSFALHMLPIDFSIVGVTHSHPSGILAPSVQDLNHFYGRIMVIIAFPYQSKKDIAVFNERGKKIKFETIG